jgi:hypothetical protein
LIQTLSQPYFDQISEKLYEQISGVEVEANEVDTQKAFNSMNCVGQRLGRWEEVSTDEDEGSAFATLLSSDGEGNEVEFRTETELGASSTQLPHTNSSEEDSESAVDAEKSAMVCRHWKTKGWCRFESQCKFLHPDHKRGITVKGSTEIVDVVPSRRSSTRKNRGKRSGSLQHQSFSNEVLVPLDMTANGCYTEQFDYGVCVSCAPGMWYVEPHLA